MSNDAKTVLLAASFAQQAALLDAQSTPALLADHLGNIVWANPAVQTLFRAGLTQLRRTPLNQWVVAASPIDTLPNILSQVIANPGQPVKLDVRLLVSQESLQAVVSATETREKTLNYPTPLDANHDTDWPIAIELINHAPALMVQAAEHRSQQQAAQRELLRNLAHEIRNPLGGIKGAAQLLARALSNNEHQASFTEYTDIIVAESTRLQSLLDRLLSAQATPIRLSLVNVHELLERARSLVEAEFPDQLQWTRDYDVSLPDVAIDEQQIMQVLMNLVRNAAQIMIETGQRLNTITLSTRALRQVTIGSKRHKLALELLVKDNGPGIPNHIYPHLFNPLVTQRAGGTGLGLHIAQSFVHLHGGLIEVNSVVGCTIFKVVLPINKL